MTSSNGAIPVRVAVRFRPLNEKELNEGCEDAIQVLEGKQIFIKSTKNAFTYDYAFGNDVDQEEVYSKSVKELIPQLFKGYNVTVLAYGQTGSGKTHSMGTTNSPSTSPELIGIIPRAIKDIFEHISLEACEDVSFVTKVSFIELYKENLYDLLSNKSQRKEECSLDIREDPKIGLYISNLSEVPVDSLSDTIIQLENGSKKRVTAATAMNNVSSRSHAIFTFHIEGTNRNNEVLVAKFHLVDLAGSERQKKTKATGERLKEGIDINKGLLALGNVIAALGEETHSSGYKHIPYRDSKLTRLLQDSIGGNSHTLMIACSSPSDSNLDETISTLRYADRARKIKNKPIVNREGKEMDKLKNEIANLKAQLEGRGNGSTDLYAKGQEYGDLQDEIDKLKTENKELSYALMNIQEEVALLHEENLKSEALNDKLKLELTELFKDPISDDENSINSKIQHLFSVNEDSRETMMESTPNETNSTIQVENEDSNDVDQSEIDTTNETPGSIALRQNNIANMIQSISKNIRKKEQLASTMTSNDETFNRMKLKYEESIRDMEAEIQKISTEKEEILNESKRESNLSMVSKQRKLQIQELKAMIQNLKKKLMEQEKLAKINGKNNSKIVSLASEILQMKQQKVKLVNQMKEEARKVKSWKLKKEQEFTKVKISEKKTNFKISKMETLHSKQINVWKRKVEESAAVNARLKAIVDKQKSYRSKTSSNGLAGSGGRVRSLVDNEIEILVGYKEAVQTRENFLKERATLTSLLNRYRKELKFIVCQEKYKEMQCKIDNIEKEIEVRSSGISNLQHYVDDLNKFKNGTSIQLDTLQNMTETKLAIEFLFEKCGDSLASLSYTRNENNDLSNQIDHLSRLCSQHDKDISDLKSNHEDVIIQMSCEHEKKVRFLLKQLPGFKDYEPSSETDDHFINQVSEIRQVSKLTEALSKMKEDNHRLKLALENKTFSMPPPTPKGSREESNLSYSPIETDSDEENVPEWKRTPLFARIRSLKRQSLTNVHNSSHNSSNSKKLNTMLEELNSDDSSSEEGSPEKRKKLMSHSGCKCQNNCDDVSNCRCRMDDKICRDCCCSFKGCSNRNQFLDVPINPALVENNVDHSIL
ncbi:chromosome-associated kinesin KIF4B [Lepeophtheirus salmonis]|uniref:chromosome-associated kinesin KIF4B n=1 Tax=Lepeophtheirus salmonis TaxID=72036 RepID=UPI001AE7DD84|nr:chromosome-associated kinesin KIF4-like [Lepeophtheirus salmonis]